MRHSIIVKMSCVALVACDHPSDETEVVESSLSVEMQRARCDAIKGATSRMGLETPVLVAGVGFAESGLAHCWSEATWTCPGPYSGDCGGSVLAGAADGACSLEQGGLGMFQLDSGTYTDTLGAHGRGVLGVAGNVSAGASFIMYKVRVCPNTPSFADDAEVLRWMNEAGPGGPNYDAFLTAMAWCYNGCSPSSSSCNHRAIKNGYRSAIETLHGRFGAEYWLSSEAPGEDGCTSGQRSDCGQFGCGCADGECSGVFCPGSGCTAKQTEDCGRFGCGCTDGQCSGGFCDGSGCTGRQATDCAAFACGCADGECSGGFCEGTGCTAKQATDCGAFGCGCVDGQCSGGFCPGSGCTAKRANDCGDYGCECSDMECRGGFCG